MILFSFFVSETICAAATPYRFSPTPAYPNEVARTHTWPTKLPEWPATKQLPSPNEDSSSKNKIITISVSVAASVLLIIVASVLVIYIVLEKKNKDVESKSGREVTETILV